MKNGFRIFFGFLVLLIIVCTNVEAAKKVVAITQVGYNANTHFQRLAANEFYTKLETAIQNCGAYTVVERGRLNSVVRELGLQQTGLISNESSVSIGKMTGAAYTVIGSVVGANVAIQDIVLYRTVKAKAEFNYKIVDNKTGEVKVAEMVKGSASKHLSDKVRLTVDQEDMLLSRAVSEAVERISSKLTELNPLVGSVMEISGNKAYVNLGSAQGVRVGDLYKVFKEGKPLRDPMGNIIGVVEEDIAYAKVVEVQPNYCVLEAKKLKGALSNRCQARKVTKKK